MHDAKLVWATPDLEKHILEIARVSNPERQKDGPVGLIDYLIREGHWSPFEMVSLCMEVNTTRDDGRHLLRHSLRPQEFSQRYADPSLLGSMVLTEARLQDPDNRQNSIPTDDYELQNWWRMVQSSIARLSQDIYQGAIEKGIAKELARKILPEGMTPTRLYLSGNLRDWLFMTEIRSGSGTQLETIQIAESMKRIIHEVAPYTAKAFYGRHER